MLTMEAAVRNAVRFLGITVQDAVALASANPAQLLGLERRKGTIDAGLDADLAVLDDDLRVCATLVEGEWVSGPPAAPVTTSSPGR
jgi:N-acetylglucosamine-6-phosphate deacetylase